MVIFKIENVFWSIFPSYKNTEQSTFKIKAATTFPELSIYSEISRVKKDKLEYKGRMKLCVRAAVP